VPPDETTSVPPDTDVPIAVPPSRYPVPEPQALPCARSALPRERFRCVLGMLSSLEVKVLCPT
jgi:hypothetical protein